MQMHLTIMRYGLLVQFTHTLPTYQNALKLVTVNLVYKRDQHKRTTRRDFVVFIEFFVTFVRLAFFYFQLLFSNNIC